MDATLTGITELKKLLADNKIIDNKIISKSDKPAVASTSRLPTNVPSQQPKSTTQNAAQPSTSKSPELKKKLPRSSFFISITENFKRVLRYEDPLLQDRVKQIVPMAKLQVAAVNKLREIQKCVLNVQ